MKLKNLNLLLTAAMMSAPSYAVNTTLSQVWIGGAGMTSFSSNYTSVASVGQGMAGPFLTGSNVSSYSGFINGFGPALAPNPIPPTLPPTIDDPLPYPNPYRPGRGDPNMTVSNLPAGVTVGIFTYAGELIRELNTDDTGSIVWDGKNRDGHDVASGVYYGLIRQGSHRKVIKLAVER